MSTINLYAEVLQNIRQITLYASLRTDQNEGTKIDISSDRRFITVTHDSETARLLLPLEISGTAEVTIPVEKKKDLSIKLALENTDAVAPANEELTPEAPWSAEDFDPSGQLKCLKCDHLLLHPASTFVWKNLPSENWAEMMDFWHCHKPHDDDKASSVGEHDLATTKGYGVTSRLRAYPGNILLDTSTFLISSKDCTGAETINKLLPNGHTEVHCSSCSHFLGFEEQQTDGWRLSKWSVAVKPTQSSPWQSYGLEIFISAILLSLIETQMVRKFIIHAGSDRHMEDGFLIWVFNPDLWYTASRRESDTSFRAMKVFYRRISNAEEMLLENSSSMEELLLPAEDLCNLENLFKESTEILPEGARKFQDWDIGLLNRYVK